ncbi:diflavin flavoprotein [Prochlorococcus sp. MIT 1223]|uniref:diflavin flavoprotein n=1 Tax=Prochlorococcus sp. MIT 1223 TaxID=3096217 RepID=UPI002A75D10E|nr:diflavin flavoprotein [Prochlorococcus sp. MIT 1223]
MSISVVKREVIFLPIENNFLCIRGLSPKKLRFEIEYGLERGSTANSFLITPNKITEPAVLIHPPGATYAEIFIKNLKNVIDTKTQPIQIIIGHINPNRVGLLKEITHQYSNVTLILSSPGTKLLKELWFQKHPSNEKNNDTESIMPLPKIQTIVNEEILRINNNYELELIPTPTARWPGGLMVLEKNLGLLMSDKFFGAHICTRDWEETTPLSTEEDRRYYYNCLMAPMSTQVNAIVERLEELEIQAIAPSHGPAIEGSWRSLLKDYQRWGEIEKRTNIKVLMLFASAYGNTASMADALSRGVSRTGIKIESINCEFVSTSQLIEAIQKADGYLIGSPTIGGHAPTPIVSALGSLLSEGDRSNPIGIFGSYGWSGEAIDLLENKLHNGGFKLGFEPIKIKFKPDPLMIKTIEETGTLFGRNLLKIKQRQQRKTRGSLNAAKSDPSMLALGRIVGSLCILTTEKGDDTKSITGAMVASWVSQASFSPLGLTVAVAKDRAIESLLYKGDKFTLNILGVKNHQEILRQFLQSFKPGENRLEGISIKKSPGGQPILPDALAWLEGCVKDRMECGDHWLIYSEINFGNVLDQNGTTAVHHRRTGANY